MQYSRGDSLIEHDTKKDPAVEQLYLTMKTELNVRLPGPESVGLTGYYDHAVPAQCRAYVVF